ncbi:hypothetical protein LXT21_25520 [Myxococcus sp. K38C18041901]|uniref:hypothetical protein n=1 Tax=Myxococcus guangdongensis TaxID=2906760 RepID=UPI0020A6F755|nr:hypothetical protein [Myxococcus guangdongensis]MCP3062152.1 hypothetical protein [Myxococcus guangdongensis]
MSSRWRGAVLVGAVVCSSLAAAVPRDIPSPVTESAAVRGPSPGEEEDTHNARLGWVGSLLAIVIAIAVLTRVRRPPS